MALNMLYNPATGRMIVSNTKNLYVVDARIKIATYADLIKIGVDDDYPITADYLQIADITQPSSIANHTPISAPNSYDGGMFKISNLTYSGDYSATTGYGLFKIPIVDSVIVKNIVFDNLDFNVYFTASSGKNLGAVSGYSGVGEISNILVLPNCNITSTNADYIGGIVGQVSSSAVVINYCESYAVINGVYAIGGIIGISSSNTIDYCISRATITNNTIPLIGGICGSIPSGVLNLDKCFSASILNITELTATTNAFVGYGQWDAIASDCYYDSTIGKSTIGTGLTTLESKLVSSYPTWDISYKASDLDTKFRIDASGTISDGYPYLTQFETALINGGV